MTNKTPLKKDVDISQVYITFIATFIESDTTVEGVVMSQVYHKLDETCLGESWDQHRANMLIAKSSPDTHWTIKCQQTETQARLTMKAVGQLTKRLCIFILKYFCSHWTSPYISRSACEFIDHDITITSFGSSSINFCTNEILDPGSPILVTASGKSVDAFLSHRHGTLNICLDTVQWIFVWTRYNEYLSEINIISQIVEGDVSNVTSYVTVMSQLCQS